MLGQLDHGLPAGVAGSRTRSPSASCCRARARSAAGSASRAGCAGRRGAAARPRSPFPRGAGPARTACRAGSTASLNASTPSAATLKAPGRSLRSRVRQRAHHVVLVHELVARVEAQDHRHDRQREQRRVGGLDVGPEHVRAAQHRDRDVRVAARRTRSTAASASTMSRSIGVARRVRPAHPLAEEGRIVLRGAVEVRRGLEDELAHGESGPAAGGEDVHRPDHVVLVRVARGGGRSSRPPAACPPPCRSPPPPRSAAAARAGSHPHELGAIELDAGGRGSRRR